MLALTVQVDKDDLQKLGQENNLLCSQNRLVISRVIKSRDKTDFKSIFVYLCVYVQSGSLIFPFLAAGMTRGNMPAGLYYPGLVDPALAES